MKTTEYRIWTGIKARCYNPNACGYSHYGGRGIVMCDRWLSSFENFYADMGPRPSAKYSIERIDNDGPYSPENCRWATDLEQANNMRSNRRITFNGKTQSLADWARELGVSPNAISLRLARGMSVEEAFSTKRFPNSRSSHYVTYQDKTWNVSDLAAQFGISVELLTDRLEHGWSVERALTTPLVNRYEGHQITFGGETKNISAWAKQLGISHGTLCKRLRSGWPIERVLTSPIDIRKRH